MSSNILDSYKILVDFLGKALGPDYEIVLHDITAEHSQIVAIANSHISDRAVGSPTTDAALQTLATGSSKTNDYLFDYPVETGDGRTLRASTLFIKDREGNPVGLLGINFDDSRYKELSEKLLHTLHPEAFLKTLPPRERPAGEPDVRREKPDSLTEGFSIDTASLMQKMLDSVTASLSMPVDRLNQSEKKDIVQKLQERGMFQLKGGISFVAKHLSCSPATVYRYLGELEA